MEQQAKADSVDREGKDDGFEPTSFYTREVLEGGYTRLVISLAKDQLEVVHRALVAGLQAPVKVMYQQLTDRRSGQLPKPVSRVAVEVSTERLLTALEWYRRLIYQDGRHQLWIQGANGAQLVLEEIGILYLYPDDPSFHEILHEAGVDEGRGESMATRDYIKVNFIAECDAEEIGLWQSLGMVEWAG
jgi:hypothetical protein